MTEEKKKRWFMVRDIIKKNPEMYKKILDMPLSKFKYVPISKINKKEKRK